MYIRISKGKFDPARTAEVAEMLRQSEEKLGPAIKRLPGLQHYYTGIDPKDGSMIAVSTWDSAEAAAGMGQLPEMAEMRAIFQAHNINFDPITNYDIMWKV